MSEHDSDHMSNVRPDRPLAGGPGSESGVLGSDEGPKRSADADRVAGYDDGSDAQPVAGAGESAAADHADASGERSHADQVDDDAEAAADVSRKLT